MANSPTIAPAEPDVDIEWVLETEEDTELDPPYRVLLHNDDVTPMDFVVRVLQVVFEFSFPAAVRVMSVAHYTGVAYVTTLGREEAKHRVGQAHGMARAAGYPLTFTIEPE